jgi:AAA domain
MVGLQGAGKSSWVARHLAGTHVVVSKDHWPNARRREDRQRRVVAALLAEGASVRKDLPAPRHSHARGGTLQAGRAGVPVRAVFLDVPLEVCRQRNEARTGRARVPDVGLFSTAARLVPPSPAEGFTTVEVVRYAAGPEDVRGRGTGAEVAMPEGSRAQTCLRPGSLDQP